jgi:hypothetical protein
MGQLDSTCRAPPRRPLLLPLVGGTIRCIRKAIFETRRSHFSFKGWKPGAYQALSRYGSTGFDLNSPTTSSITSSSSSSASVTTCASSCGRRPRGLRHLPPPASNLRLRASQPHNPAASTRATPSRASARPPARRRHRRRRGARTTSSASRGRCGRGVIQRRRRHLGELRHRRRRPRGRRRQNIGVRGTPRAPAGRRGVHRAAVIMVAAAAADCLPIVPPLSLWTRPVWTSL